MRYPQGGGLTAERQQFALGEASPAIAADLRVSVRSVQRWRRTWSVGGPARSNAAPGAAVPCGGAG
ncbi:helix-turn-helix domain-containing protein [Streptomyces sp. WAC07061]|uniref:helix-turn-helix domain-containing protein n=1 Tax=Streptomyces sp. WAC07061 TaxID=2487410 RepID=UPI0034D2C463